jgi:hypothetical protein
MENIMKVDIKDRITVTDLNGEDLRGADLRGADLSGANLRGANLRGANLNGAELSRADLRGAELSEASLRGTGMDGADLSEADVFSVAASEATGNYMIFMTNTHLKIGCEFHTITDWIGFDESAISKMDGERAIEFWRIWKPILQQIAKNNGWIA